MSLKTEISKPEPRYFRTQYDRLEDSISFPDDEENNRTKQEFKDDCDINLIMARYKKTGILPESARAAAARYGDFSDVPSYQEMYDRVLAADELFAALPADVRLRFDNDPGAFIAASETKEGQEILVELGLAKRRTEHDALMEKEKPSLDAAPASAGQADPLAVARAAGWVPPSPPSTTKA